MTISLCSGCSTDFKLEISFYQERQLFCQLQYTSASPRQNTAVRCPHLQNICCHENMTIIRLNSQYEHTGISLILPPHPFQISRFISLINTGYWFFYNIYGLQWLSCYARVHSKCVQIFHLDVSKSERKWVLT